MKRFVIPVLLLLQNVSCKKVDVSDDTPHCLKKEIRDFESVSTCSDAKVDEYEFQSKKVYVFDPGHCMADAASPVIDSKCNAMGSLGGFAGNTQINGADFGAAKFLRTVWKK